MRVLLRILPWLASIGLLALTLSAAQAGGKPAAGPRPAVTEAKLGVEPDLTRVELSLSSPTQYRIFTLADPNRVVIDLAEIAWRVPGGKKLEGHGLIAGLRYGLYKSGTSRVVLDLAAPSMVADARIVPAQNGQPARL